MLATAGLMWHATGWCRAGPRLPHPRTPMGARLVRPGDGGCPCRRSCRVDKHRGIPRGARTYLMLTGWTSGLIAQSSSVCPFLGARLDRPVLSSQHVMVEWTQTLGPDLRIPLEILQAEMPEAGWLPLTREASAVPLTCWRIEVHPLWQEWLDRKKAERSSVRRDSMSGSE